MMATKTTKNHQELEALADYLSEKEEIILEKWTNKIKEEGVESKDLLSLSQEAFRNNMPVFLEHFYQSIRDGETSSKIVGEKHGAQRWEHGLDLQETMKEWNILHLVLRKEIYAFQEKYELSLPSLRKAQQYLTEHINDGIEFSVKEYHQLEQQEAEAQFRDLEQALEEPEDLARSHNLRSTSHDLKGIMQNLQMGFFLLEDKELNEEVADLIDQMSMAADSLEQLLNDLLELFRLETRREEVNLSEFNVSDVLRDLCESLQPMAKSASLEFRYEGPSSLSIKSDYKKIERIARNLILNALKYTKKGYVEVKWEVKSDSQWLLKVTDTGPGLNATHAEALTTDKKTSEDIKTKKTSPRKIEELPKEVQNHGEGIGLLIVRQLCKLLHANISIDSEPNAGTAFKILIPRNLD